jgi:sec-independent protein translocase protein TatC
MTMTDDPEEHTMTFWEHLEELRTRIVRALLASLIGVGVCWYYREKLLVWLTKPFMDAWAAGHIAGKAALHFPAPAALFVAYIKIAIVGGLVLALPITLYQLWSFVAPGLYSKEKRLALPFVFCSTLLFATGGYFGWRVAFPIAFQYLLGFSGTLADGFEVTPTVMVGDYIEFVSRMLLAFGSVFELPVLIFFLSIAGVVNHKQLIRFFRYFIVVAFVVSAVITPPDVTSQFLLAVPLVGLYGISIGIAWLVDRNRARQAKRQAAAEQDADDGEDAQDDEDDDERDSER